MRTPHNRLWVLLIALTGATAQAVLVTATGRAVDGPVAREQALADALREAVRQGAGVDVAGVTKVRDFATEFDRVLACSFGHVRSYRVLRQGVDDSGWYTVDLEADVVKGAPEVADRMGMQMLIRLKGSPRVMIEADERLDGLPVDQPAAGAVLTQAAVDLGLQVTDPGAADGNAVRRGTRAAILGDTQDAALRLVGTTPEADFVLRAEVSADVGKPKPEYGPELRTVALSVNLSARWAETGKVIVQRALPVATLTSSAPTPAGALQDTLKAMLWLPGREGGPTPTDDLLRAVVTRWLVELDLGTLVRAEIRQVPKPAFDRLTGGLAETQGIGEVWARAFDARHLSVIEFESRLDAAQAAEAIVSLLGGTHGVDAATSHYILLVPTGPGEVSGTRPGAMGPGGSPLPNPSDATAVRGTGRPKPWLAVAGLLVLALASGTGLVLHWRRTRP
jgi:hypothetical protein